MMKQYEKYKDSGIAWIGEIPEGWEVKRLKYCIDKSFAGVWGEDAKNDDNDVRCYRVADFNYNKLCLSNNNPTNRNIDRKIFDQRVVRLGDILIEKSGGGDKSPVGRAVFVNYPHNAICSNFVHCIKTKKNVCSKYLVYLLCSMYSKKVNVLFFNQTTGIQNLDVAGYLNNQTCIPSFSEQQQIADYLDRKCGEIDELVSLQEKMIEELKSYKQSVITETVTKGLDLNVSLRDSGIEWIGEIPEGWEVKRLKYCIDKSFAGVWGEDAKNDDNDVRCYRVADFNYNKLCLSNNNPTNRNIDRKIFDQRVVRLGDILIEKSGGGDKSPVGRAVFVNYPHNAICSNFVHCIKTKKNVCSKYLVYLLCSMYSKKVNVLFFNQTTGIQNLDVAGYLNNQTCIPSFSEQQQIADYLDKKCADIDQLIAIKQQKIEELKEYKKSTIFEYVTGKKRVTN